MISNKARLHELLAELGRRTPYVSFKSIRAAVNEAELDLKDKSLKNYLGHAVEQKLIYDAGRGWYSSHGEPVRLDTSAVRPMIRVVEKNFPLLDFTVWSTGQVNPWMHHLIGKPIFFLNAPGDALEAVGDVLKTKGYDVWVNPTGKDKRRFTVGERTVVLRPLVSRAPADGHHAPVDALLVDLFMEVKALGIMDTTEYHGMVGSLLASGLVPMSTLVDYIKRRKLKVRDVLDGHVMD